PRKRGSKRGDQGRRRGRIVEPPQDGLQRLIDAGMRLALGQKPAQSREMGYTMEGMRRHHEACCAQRRPLDQIEPEMFIQPRPPGYAHRIAGLENAAQPRARSAAHEPQMPAMRMRHQFENDATLAVALHPEHDTVVDPFHGSVYIAFDTGGSTAGRSLSALLFGEFQTHRAVTLGVVRPAFAHLNLKKKVHRLLDRRSDFAARRGADRLERLAAFSQ